MTDYLAPSKPSQRLAEPKIPIEQINNRHSSVKPDTLALSTLAGMTSSHQGSTIVSIGAVANIQQINASTLTYLARCLSATRDGLKSRAVNGTPGRVASAPGAGIHEVWQSHAAVECWAVALGMLHTDTTRLVNHQQITAPGLTPLATGNTGPLADPSSPTRWTVAKLKITFNSIWRFQCILKP